MPLIQSEEYLVLLKISVSHPISHQICCSWLQQGRGFVFISTGEEQLWNPSELIKSRYEPEILHENKN